MTRPRYDNHSTEFGLWLRNQWELDSKRYGFSATNLDYVWCNYKDNRWMLLEEKRHGSESTLPVYSQRDLFRRVHCGMSDKDYYGFHFLVFSHTSPDDSEKMWLNHKLVNRSDLIEFLKFGKDKTWYKTKVVCCGKR